MYGPKAWCCQCVIEKLNRQMHETDCARYIQVYSFHNSSVVLTNYNMDANCQIDKKVIALSRCTVSTISLRWLLLAHNRQASLPYSLHWGRTLSTILIHYIGYVTLENRIYIYKLRLRAQSFWKRQWRFCDPRIAFIVLTQQKCDRRTDGHILMTAPYRARHISKLCWRSV